MPTAAAGLNLKHFAPNEVVISNQDAQRILRFFFADPVLEANELTANDVAFAQALLLEGIDKSYAMGYVHIVYDSFYMKIPGSFDAVSDMVKDFAKKAAQQWFDHASGKDLENPQIYNSIRAMIRANFRSVWVIRMQSGELIY